MSTILHVDLSRILEPNNWDTILGKLINLTLYILRNECIINIRFCVYNL